MKGDNPAFPEIGSYENNVGTNRKVGSKSGMTLKEYYVGKAIQGLCTRTWRSDMKKSYVEWVSDMAIEIADEVIKKLDEETK